MTLQMLARKAAATLLAFSFVLTVAVFHSHLAQHAGVYGNPAQVQQLTDLLASFYNQSPTLFIILVVIGFPELHIFVGAAYIVAALMP